MFTRLLVPIDAGPDSRPALPFACQLARSTGARLVLLRVVLAHEGGTADSSLAPNLETHQLAVDLMGPDGHPAVDVVIRRAMHADEIPTAIVAETRARGADLIVMATHARSGLDRLTHPSVAERVLASSPVPLLLINSSHEGGAVAASDPLLVAVDGSPDVALAISVAAQYAQALDTEIVLLRVVTPRFAEGSATALHYDQAVLDDAQHYVDRLVARLRSCGVRAQGRAMFGPVAETIGALAEQLHAGAIAISTHSLFGTARLVHGSVADTVLRDAPCPLLLVRREAGRLERVSNHA